MDVKNLEEILSLKLGPNKKIDIVDITQPPAKGFGSLMLKVQVFIKDENNEEELLHLVAKKIPTGEEIREYFDIQNTFKKEAAFYEIVVPILDDFQKEECIEDVLDNFAKFYGARFNLESKSEVVDEDGVMLMEDLCIKGFDNIDRGQGFDLVYAEKILQDLAKLHGTGIALKFKKPEVFNEKIRSILTPFKFVIDGAVGEMFKIIKQLIETSSEYKHLSEKALNFTKVKAPTYREPFATICHCDLWVNNIMNKVENDGDVKNIFIDFQVYDYRSPASDVFFFLMTSVKKSVLNEHLDQLLAHYHQNLIKTLQNFDMDIALFEYSKFEEEIGIVASNYEIGHSLLFTFFLGFVPKIGQEPDFSNIKLDDLSSELKESLLFIVKESAKRGWLK